MPNFFGFLDSFGLFFNTQLNGKRKIFSSKNLGSQGPSLDPRAKFGLFSDPGGLANDVSKAKNLVQIFSGENACFSQSWPVKALERLISLVL